MTGLSQYLRKRFGGKVQKIAVDAGFTCPNRDGTSGYGGCTYCVNEAFSPPYCRPSLSVSQQLEDGKRFFAKKGQPSAYLAYFQSHTGTYAAMERLQALHEEALAVEGVKGIVIATRPDAVDEEVTRYLAQLSRRAYLMVELGVETMHDSTLRLVNRCHTWDDSRNAINRLAHAGIDVGAHLILGLPNETVEQMEQTVNAIGQLPVTAVKFHQLQVLAGTTIAEQLRRGDVAIQRWNACEYAAVCARLLRLLPARVLVDRVVAQAPSRLLLYPKWGLKPSQFSAMLKEEMSKFDNIRK